ncbi:MAG: zinc ribbon domain-containing protein [Solobacterium sp.]|nr:zinc ribbon domain-containing protein [Solobacterium sp.]
MMEFGTDFTRVYPLADDISVQNAAYALAEYLDLKKNMITQTMRTRNGYTVQCKGDASAEWTKYLGMDAAISVEMQQLDNKLTVNIGFEKWTEKLGMAALGAIIFHPLLITSGIGVLRQLTLPQDIFSFLETYLRAEPISEEPAPERTAPAAETVICPVCGAENKAGARFCKVCGESLEKKELYCPECGEVLDGDEVFCPRCGTKLR